MHPDARIGPQVVIGEYAMVEEDVVIGACCRLEPYVYVKRWTTLGERNEISAGTVLGTDPLDKNFTGRTQLSADRRRQHHSRALYDFARHAAGERDGDRRWQLHHDVGTHRAQLQDREQLRDRELRAGGRVRGGGGSGFHFGRRGGFINIRRSGGWRWSAGMSRVNSDLPPFFLYSDSM